MRFSSLIRTSGVVAACAAAAALSLIPGRAAHAEIIYGITATNLVSFDSAAPATIQSSSLFTGVVAGQTLRSIDFRPSNGLLYALSSDGATAAQLYTVNLATGALTAVGSGITLTGTASTVVSIDFNPVADALRVVTGSDTSYRVNAGTGALILQDTNITPTTPLVADIAYSNNFAGATSTTLYSYDYIADQIGTIGGIGGTPSPNTGAYTVIGNSGILTTGGTQNQISFDISGTGVAYLGLTTSANAGLTSLYTANLSTGAVGTGANTGLLLNDIAVRITPSAAPEPGSLSLLGMGLVSGAGTLGIVRRKRKAA